MWLRVSVIRSVGTRLRGGAGIGTAAGSVIGFEVDVESQVAGVRHTGHVVVCGRGAVIVDTIPSKAIQNVAAVGWSVS